MPRHARVLVAAALVLAATALGYGQGTTPAPLRSGSAFVSGRAVDHGTNQPLTGVVVTLTGRGMPPQRVVVDQAGRFAFRSLPAGLFNLAASKPGYLGGQLNQRDPMAPGHPLELAEGQPLGDVTLPLWKLGVLSGSAFGDAGAPLVEAEVHALRRSLVSGQWQLTEGPTTTTDDRGRYRLGGLTPGEYILALKPSPHRDTALLLAVLSANPGAAADIMTGAAISGQPGPEPDGLVKNYPVAFYPAAASPARATTVTVATDAERTGLDFRVRSDRGVRVVGTVTGFAGAVSGLTVRLISTDADAEGWSIDAAVTACEEDGRFEFSGVPPGRYVAVVVWNPSQALLPNAPPQGPPPGGPGGQPMPQPLPAEPTWWTRAPVTVGTTDLKGLTLPLHKGLVVRGSTRFDGTMPPPSIAELSQIGIRLEPADQPAPPGNATWRGRIEADGRFTTMGVPAGRYFLRVTTPPRYWMLQSAMSDDRDALDAPLEIRETDIGGVVLTFGNRPLAILTGTSRDAQGNVAADSSVLVFPTDRALWADTSPASRRLRSVRPLQGGTYTVQGLPAGEYFVAAISKDPSPTWQDPQSLAAIAAHATRVRVESGETRAVDLQVVIK